MLTNYQDAHLWDTPFETLHGHTPRQWLAPEGAGGFTFHSYVKGEYGQRFLENLLPWLNFGVDNMNLELLSYWEAKGIKKEIHKHPDDPDRTWFSYRPLDWDPASEPLPVWYINHVKHRDILDIEAWGFVRYTSEKRILIITVEDGNSEEIFFNTLAAAAREYSIDSSRVYLVGHSLSGSCAGRIALRFANRLTGVCMLGSQYVGLDSTSVDIQFAMACRLPRVDIHGLAEHILPYNKTLGFASPKIYPNVTPGDMGLEISFQEQCLWRSINHCPPIEKAQMVAAAYSGDPVERKLGVPVDRSKVFALGSVRHFQGDVTDWEGHPVMRWIGVEGAPHYPSAYAGMLALEFLSRFSRNQTTGKLEYSQS